MDCEFKQVDVQYLGNSGAYICWRLSSDAVYFSGEYQFYVDFGWPATDTWITLNEQPIIDDCCYYDVCKRNWATLIEAYYRVRLILPGEPGCPVYKSQPIRANGMLSRKDWLVARDIVRREYLQQKYETTYGKLFVRKKFGRACPVCLDWDTKEITNSDCPVCYGTGIIGGYYPAVDYNITTQPGWNRRIVSGEPPRGTHSDITKPTNRSVLYPAIDTRDVWLRNDNSERYIIDSYTVIAQFKSVPLIVSPVLKLAPMTDIVYSIPLVPSSSSSSSSVSSMSEAACDVNSGLDSSYEDW